MKKTQKAFVFSMALTAIMGLSATSVFAHHGGGGCHGGYYGGYYNTRSNYSNPNYYNYNPYVQPQSAPQATSQPIQQDTQTPIIVNVSPEVKEVNSNEEKNNSNEKVVVQEIVNENEALAAQKIAEAKENAAQPVAQAEAVNNTIPTPAPAQSYVCPNGNALCNQYGYCINNGYCGNGYCGRYIYQ